MSTRFSTHAAGAAMILSLVACNDEFASRTQLDSYRVVGVVASPPEVTPDDAVTLTAHDFNPNGDALAYEWTACLYGLGAAQDFECADPALQFELGNTQTVNFDLAQLGIRELLASVGDVPEVDGRPRSLERGFDIWVRLDSGPDCRGCEISTVKRVRVRESNESPNENPLIEDFRIVGDTVGATTVSLQVDVSQPERYENLDSGETTREEYLYTWYSTVGETDPPLTFGDARSTELKLGQDDPSVTVMVAVRDGRGGLAVETLVIER